MLEELRSSGNIPRVFRTGAAARTCQVSRLTIIEALDKGAMRGYRVPESRHRRITYDNLVQGVQEQGLDTSSIQRHYALLVLEQEEYISQTRDLLRAELAGLMDDVRVYLSSELTFDDGIQLGNTVIDDIFVRKTANEFPEEAEAEFVEHVRHLRNAFSNTIRCFDNRKSIATRIQQQYLRYTDVLSDSESDVTPIRKQKPYQDLLRIAQLERDDLSTREVGLLFDVNSETVQHWRSREKGLMSSKTDRDLMRFSKRDVLQFANANAIEMRDMHTTTVILSAKPIQIGKRKNVKLCNNMFCLGNLLNTHVVNRIEISSTYIAESGLTLHEIIQYVHENCRKFNYPIPEIVSVKMSNMRQRVA